MAGAIALDVAAELLVNLQLIARCVRRNTRTVQLLKTFSWPLPKPHFRSSVSALNHRRENSTRISRAILDNWALKTVLVLVSFLSRIQQKYQVEQVWP